MNETKNKLLKYSKEVLVAYVQERMFFVDFKELESIKHNVEFKKCMNRKEEIHKENKKLFKKLDKAEESIEQIKIIKQLSDLDKEYRKLDAKTDKLLGL